MKKKIIISVLLISMILVSYHFYSHRRGDVTPADVTLVELSAVSLQNIPITYQTLGNLVAANTVHIAPLVGGKIQQVFFKDGQFVKKGSPLIQLENSVSKSKLQSAQVEYDMMQKNLERMQYLLGKGVISKQELEKANADLQTKKAILAELKDEFDKTILTAPFDGVLDKLTTSVGNFVTGGQTLITLTDVKNLRVEYKIPEKFLGLLKQDQAVDITAFELPSEKFNGHLRFIAPTLNYEDRTISLYASVKNDNQLLKPGLFVNVVHHLGVKPNSMVIPTMSLVATMDGHEVYVVQDGKAKVVPVTTGEQMNGAVEILQGLKPQDKVIVAGQFKIKDGMPVKVKVS